MKRSHTTPILMSILFSSWTTKNTADFSPLFVAKHQESLGLGARAHAWKGTKPGGRGAERTFSWGAEVPGRGISGLCDIAKVIIFHSCSTFQVLRDTYLQWHWKKTGPILRHISV